MIIWVKKGKKKILFVNDIIFFYIIDLYNMFFIIFCLLFVFFIRICDVDRDVGGKVVWRIILDSNWCFYYRNILIF